MLYEAVLSYQYQGQQCINRWNYLSTGVPAAVSGSFGLAYALGFILSEPPDPEAPAGTLLAELVAALPDEVVFESATVRAAADYDPEDFYEVLFPASFTGEDAGEAAAPFLAYGFRTNRVRTDISRGTKRFAGVVEGAMMNGGTLSSSAITLLNGWADIMSAVLEYTEDGESLSYTPCVVSKLEYTTPSGKRAYKYYSTLALQLDHLAVGVTWQPYQEVRSQVSRQYGRGN